MKIKIAGKVFEIDNETLSKAIEDNTESVSIDSDYIIRTTEENDTFVNNIKDQQIKIGKEIGIKEFKKVAGIEIEGKDYTKVADAFRDRIISESNVSISDKEKKWKTDLETLKGSNSDLLQQVENEKNARVSMEKNYKISGMLRDNMPKNLAFPSQDMQLILSNRFEFDIQDGSFVAKDKATGAVMQDNVTLNPTPIDKVLGGFFEQNQMYLKGVDGGTAGSDSNSTGKTNVEAYTKTLNEAGHATNSPQFNAEMQKAIDAGTVSIDD